MAIRPRNTAVCTAKKAQIKEKFFHFIKKCVILETEIKYKAVLFMDIKEILKRCDHTLLTQGAVSEDIFALPLQVHSLCPDYKLYLRRYPYIPAWDLNLICTL